MPKKSAIFFTGIPLLAPVSQRLQVACVTPNSSAMLTCVWPDSLRALYKILFMRQLYNNCIQLQCYKYIE